MAIWHIIYCIFFSSCAIQSSSEFVGKTQTSFIRHVVTSEWRLQLMPDSMFIYRISEFNSEKFLLGIKNDTVFYRGTWHYLKDTLILSDSELNDRCKEDIKYHKKGDKLFSLGSCIDSTVRGTSMAFLRSVKKKG